MKPIKISALAAGIAIVGFPALSEITVGGDITFEFNRNSFGFGDFEEFNARGEVIVGYDTGDVFLGTGLRFDTPTDEIDDLELDEVLYFLAAFGPVTLSYGNQHGAGGLLPEDYFLWSDATSSSPDTFRLDLDLGAAKVAASVDDNDDFEVALLTSIGGNFVAAAFEESGDDLFLLTGRDLGSYGYQVGALIDFDSDGFEDQIGGTVFYDLDDSTRIAFNSAFSPGEGLHSYGIAAWYELNPGTSQGTQRPITLRGELVYREVDEQTSFEIGINIPFGRTPPASFERSQNKGAFSGFGYYNAGGTGETLGDAVPWSF